MAEDTDIKYNGIKINGLTIFLYSIALLSCIWTGLSIYILLIFTILMVLSLPFRINIDKTAIFLSVFSFFYCLFLLFSNISSWFNVVSYLLCPTCFYILGKYVTDRLRTPQNIALFWCISILLFSFVYLMYNKSRNFFKRSQYS